MEHVAEIPVQEGFVQFRDCRTRYRIDVDLANVPAGKFPLLIRHGRPGAFHDCPGRCSVKT